MNGEKGNCLGPTGNDRGAGPAEFPSPDYQASQQPPDPFEALPMLRRIGAAAAELTRGDAIGQEMEPMGEGDGAEIEIDIVYRRKLMGARSLPRRERAGARRAAREWRLSALRALREKRAGLRHARYLLRRLKTPALG